MKRWRLVLLFAAILAVCAAFAQNAPPKEQKKEIAKGDATRGEEVFLDNCDQCHDAYSKEEKVGPGLKGIKDGKLPDGRPATHDKLLDVINTGPAEMPSFKDRLTEREKEDVVAFVMTL